MKSYRDLAIYKLSWQIAIKAHELSLKFPKYELYEQGSQFRRSMKSTKDNIVEGFGRRRYKMEFIRFLIYAHSSNDEAISQLEMINEIHFKDDPNLGLYEELDKLGRKINNFIKYVESNWNNFEPE